MRPLHVITLRHPVITGLDTDAPVMDALITAVARVMVAATGMAAGTTAGVATTAAVITAAAMVIALRLQVRDPVAEMAPAPVVVAGMAIPEVAVAADHVPALGPAEVATGETAVSVVVVTADQAAATAELQNGAPRSAVFYGMTLTVEVYHPTPSRLKPVLQGKPIPIVGPASAGKWPVHSPSCVRCTT